MIASSTYPTDVGTRWYRRGSAAISKAIATTMISAPKREAVRSFSGDLQSRQNLPEAEAR